MEFRNKEGKLIGKLNNGVFSKNVKRSKHYMRTYRGWGIDSGVVQSLHDLHCKEIKIRDTENKKTYRIPLDKWEEKMFERNHGYGLQQFVTEKEFITS
jgi:hypothetical protein